MTLPPNVAREHGEGWNHLVNELWAAIVERCEELGIEPPEVQQCKQKFGGLRFYVSSTHVDVLSLIETAEDASYHVCELCGEPGRLRGKAWLTVRCDTCALGGLW